MSLLEQVLNTYSSDCMLLCYSKTKAVLALQSHSSSSSCRAYQSFSNKQSLSVHKFCVCLNESSTSFINETLGITRHHHLGFWRYFYRLQNWHPAAFGLKTGSDGSQVNVSNELAGQK